MGSDRFIWGDSGWWWVILGCGEWWWLYFGYSLVMVDDGGFILVGAWFIFVSGGWW